MEYLIQTQIEEQAKSKYIIMTDSLIDRIGAAEEGERKYYTINRVEPPENLKCKFCGKELKYELEGEEHFKYWKVPSKCNCKKAVEYWKLYNEEINKINLEIEEYKETEYKKIEIERIVSRSNLGRRFINRNFKTFTQTPENESAYNKSLDYATNFFEYERDGKGLLYIGQVGTGKTHLSASIANHLMYKKLIPVKFGNVTALLGEIKDTYSNKDISESDLIYSLSNIRLLIIDDLGKEKTSAWSNNIIYTIINNRYENYKPVIVTTNLSLKDLENQIGEATVSRLIEMTDGIKMNGFDYRKGKLI